MAPFFAFLHGLAAYALFFGTLLYAVGYAGGFAVPKTIDSGVIASLPESLIVNLLLMSLLTLQHSPIAHRRFKEWWTRHVPKPAERGTYARNLI